MDISSASLLACGLAYRWTSPSPGGSDSDLSGLSGLSSPETLSPLGYLDSSFSPPPSSSSSSSSSSSDPQPPSRRRRSALDPEERRRRRRGAGGLTPGSPGSAGSPPSSSSSSTAAAAAAGSVGRPAARRGGRVRSKQRESASEKEKMRMRDLTKALHHLRSFLPASVAPAGQTLTKIETLRLAISYIAHLSAQLGPAGQGPLFEGSPREEEGAPSADTLRYFQSLCSSAAAQWGDQQGPPAGQGQGQGQYQTTQPLPPVQAAAVHPGNCSYGIDVHGYNSGQYGGQCAAAPQGGVFANNMEISLLSPGATHHSHCQPNEYILQLSQGVSDDNIEHSFFQSGQQVVAEQVEGIVPTGPRRLGGVLTAEDTAVARQRNVSEMSEVGDSQFTEFVTL
ncbi:unnamed protein product [Boreogadus saida]